MAMMRFFVSALLLVCLVALVHAQSPDTSGSSGLSTYLSSYSSDFTTNLVSNVYFGTPSFFSTQYTSRFVTPQSPGSSSSDASSVAAGAALALLAACAVAL